MMRLGIGVGVGRQRFAGGFADSYSSRVLADGGTIESLSCVANASTLLQQASLLFIPSGYKAGVAYSALPNNGNGDLSWSRNSTANRTNSSGVISSVGANVPRLSYMYGSCPAALLEPQRTNLIFPSATASTQTRTVTAVAHTLSFFGTGSVTLSGVATGTLNGTGANNRVTLTFTPTAGSLTLTVVGSVTNWQLEAGSYATTLIDTTSATATRLADTASKSLISSLIGQTEGVIYWEGIVLNQTDIIGINRSTVNGIYLTKGSGNLYRASICNSSNVISFADIGVKTTLTKIAIAYKSGDSALFVNGVKIGATNTSTITFSASLSELRLNDDFLIGTAPQFTNTIAIFNTRLSDSDCITLTT